MQGGLPGCGQQTAVSVVSYGCAQKLCAAFLARKKAGFDRFLTTWREEICKILRDDPTGLLGRRQPTLAARMTAAFPNAAALQAYLRPQIHGHLDGGSIYGRGLKPDVLMLAGLCDEYFGWTAHSKLLKVFRRLIWPGILLQLLVDRLMIADAAGKAYLEVSRFGHLSQFLPLKYILGTSPLRAALLSTFPQKFQLKFFLSSDYKAYLSAACSFPQKSWRLR
jgi:hypothetical protein